MKLTKYQKAAIGSNESLPKFIWNNNMSKIYKPIDPKNIDLSDGQTFAEFLQMEKRQPNESGTGRYKFNRINKLQYFFIKQNKTTNPSLKTIQIINHFIKTFLRIPVQYRKELKMTVDKNNIIHKTNNIVYIVKQVQNRLDVYDLLDILMEYREQGTILLALIEKGLQEEGDELDGRACGDGVAVVAYDYQDFTDTELLLQTSIHEILHTLGFDHCIAWKCLMNAWTNFESWLCPACSRKLYHELNLTTENDVKQWIESILSLTSVKNKKKGEQLIKSFHTV